MPIKGSPRTKGRKANKNPDRDLNWIEHLVCGWELGFARGVVEGKAEAVLEILKRRQLPVSAAIRTRVLATRDLVEVERWLDRAFTVASGKALFESPPARSRRRSGTTPTQSAHSRAKLRVVAT